MLAPSLAVSLPKHLYFFLKFRSLLARGLNRIGSVDVTAAIIANLGHLQIEA